MQPTTPPHGIQLESRMSPRCRAQGARFSVSCAKPAPLRAFRATSPPALQITTLSHPTTPSYLSHVDSRKSRRCRAQGARFSVRVPNRPPLVHFGLQAPQLFNSSRSRSLRGSSTLVTSLPTSPTAAEPRRLEFWFHLLNGPPRAYFSLIIPNLLLTLSTIFYHPPALLYPIFQLI